MRISASKVGAVAILLAIIGITLSQLAATDLRSVVRLPPTLGIVQLQYLLILVAALFALYEFADASRFSEVVGGICLLTQPRRSPWKRCTTLLWWILSALLVALGVLVPIWDLVGTIPTGPSSFSDVAPQIALLLLTSSYIYGLVDRPRSQAEKIRKVLEETGRVNILSRAEAHDFMSSMLDDIAPESEIYVTHFEEPRHGMQESGSYYENAFMAKWYLMIHEKRLRVTQILLINSMRDIEAMHTRLRYVGDASSYAMAYIIAPPLTLFMDFLLVPGRFALLFFSDNPGMRNMNVYALLLREGPGVRRFEHLFTDVLLPEAFFVKTFEGVDAKALQTLQGRAAAIGRMRSKLVGEMFEFRKPTQSEDK